VVPLKLIKVGSKKLTSIKLFFIAKSRRILEIRRPRLIRINYRYKSSLVLSKSRP
jgi:hypothetical protein